MRRKIVQIDRGSCTGCALCVEVCPNRALEIADGVARLVDDSYCCYSVDCIGSGCCFEVCPEEAIKIVEREGKAYDKRTVAARLSNIGLEPYEACCGDGAGG